MRYKRYVSTHLKDNVYRRIIRVTRRQQRYKFSAITPSTYDNFIKINGIIYFVQNSESLMHNLFFRHYLNQIGYGEQKAPLTVLNKITLDSILDYIAKEELPRKIKTQFMYGLKQHSPMRVIKDYPSSKCIFDLNGAFLKFENDRFVFCHILNDYTFNHQISTPAIDIIDGYMVTTLNNYFISGDYQISDATKNMLRKITGGNPDSLKALAMLTASAYSNDLPLNKAIIMVADASSCEVVDSFFRILFDYNVYTLKRSALKNVNSFFTAYKDTLLMNGGTYIFKEDANVNFSTVKNLVKSNFIEVKGKKSETIRFKNKIPLIVLTESKDYADKFGCRINSYTINVDKDFKYIDYSFMNDLIPLRQALALYGLKLLSNPTKNTRLPKNNAASIKTVVKEFAELYCKSGSNKYTSKTELREAFNKYLSVHYPSLKEPPIAICNHFTEHGFKTVKKRSDKYENPIWVIQGIEFNAEKFNNDIAPLINKSRTENIEDEFDKAFSELLASKIETSVRVYNV